jgi:hypothetical protein
MLGLRANLRDHDVGNRAARQLWHDLMIWIANSDGHVANGQGPVLDRLLKPLLAYFCGPPFAKGSRICPGPDVVRHVGAFPLPVERRMVRSSPPGTVAFHR